MTITDKIILALRSALFYSLYVSTGAIQGFICMFLPYLVPLKKRYGYITSWNRFIVWWLSVSVGIKVHIEGLENIPTTPIVVLSKHQSPWETMFLLPRFNPLTVILKRELLRIPFFGSGLKSLNPIAIDRSSPKEAIKQVMNIGQERIKDGYSVLVFPEGTRINPGNIGNYARSGAGLCVATNTSAIFVAHNSGNCWPSHKFLKYPGIIKVKFSQPISPEGKTAKQLTDEAKLWIEDEVRKMGGRNTPI